MSAMLLPRLDPHASHRVFKVLFEALSRPGQLTALGSDRTLVESPALLVALALADIDVRVHVLAPTGSHAGSHASDWSDAIHATTGATRSSLEAAELVVALRPPTPDEIRSLRRGSADAPELGARLAVACTRLADTDGEVIVSLRGPGVPEARRVAFDGVPVEVLETLASVNLAFPAGVDTFFVADDGIVVGLPRTSRIEIMEGSSSWVMRP